MTLIIQCGSAMGKSVSVLSLMNATSKKELLKAFQGSLEKDKANEDMMRRIEKQQRYLAAYGGTFAQSKVTASSMENYTARRYLEGAGVASQHSAQNLRGMTGGWWNEAPEQDWEEILQHAVELRRDLEPTIGWKLSPLDYDGDCIVKYPSTLGYYDGPAKEPRQSRAMSTAPDIWGFSAAVDQRPSSSPVLKRGKRKVKRW